jgi:hypothetical protein
MTERFEQRLLAELSLIREQLPMNTPASFRPLRRARLRRPVVLVAAVSTLIVAGGATATAMAVFTDRDKNLGPGMADTVAPGETTRIKGMDCEPGSLVTARLDGVKLATAITESRSEGPQHLVLGWYQIDVTIPADTTAGPHTITVTCPYKGDGTEMIQSKSITVAP